MKKRLVAAVIAALAFAVIPGTKVSADSADRISDNIYIGGVDVGGMTEGEAVSAVSEYVEELGEKTIHMTFADNEVSAKISDFDLKWNNKNAVGEVVNIGKTGNIIERYKIMKDLEHENVHVELDTSIDESLIGPFVETRICVYNIKPQDYSLKRVDGEFVISDGNNGLSVDKAAAEKSISELIATALEDDGETSYTVEIPAEVTRPTYKKEDFELVTDVLGTFTTDFSSSAWGRSQNVKNGASKIDGTVLLPGEELSVYDLVNPMTAENGYELAGSYENGSVVETYGGGICQVSSTLYNAAIRAEMKIEERYPHSMVVSYVQPSMDAAMAGTYKNLRFSNPYDYPVYIEGSTYNGKITFTIYGHETRPANREISFVSETTGTTEAKVQFTKNSGQPVGYVNTTQGSHQGKSAQLWKIVTVDGVQESKEIFNRSNYTASPRIIDVGVAGASSDQLSQINDAIASGSEDKVRSVCASLKSSAEKPADSDSGSGDADSGSGSTDSGSGSTDSGSGNTDTGSTDSGSTDTGSTDTGSTDTGSTDTGSTDTGSTDSGSTDSGSTETAPSDGGTDGGETTETPGPDGE